MTKTPVLPPLRECQIDALENYESQRFEECSDETNISMCTGSGKSRVIYEISQKDNVVIIVFPSLLLLSQYYNDFHKLYKETHELRFLATEIKDDEDKHVKKIQRFESDDLDCFENIVVLTTYISAPIIYDDLKDDDVITSIDLIIHDEAHHIYAPIYNTSLEACKHNVMHQLNLSATLPEDCVADYRYSLLQGIKDKVVRDFNMELFLCTSRDREHGQVIEKMMHKLISLHENVRLLIYTSEANTTHDVSSSVSTFLTKFAPIFKKNKWWIRGLNQDTQREKSSILKQFQSHQGKFKCIVSCKTLSEGVDLKGANCMLPWDASKSAVDNIQRIGRVVRLLRDAKNKLLEHDKQKPSTVMIPIFVDYDKYNAVREDRVEQHKLLYKEIEQGKNGNFYPFVAICGALKSELLDDDEELFNNMIANFKPKTPAKVNQSLFECLGKILHKTPETLKQYVDELPNENNTENSENDDYVFEALAEKENMTLNIYVDDDVGVDDDTQAQETNSGGVHSFGNNCEKVVNIQHTKFGYKQLTQQRKRELDVKHSIKHKVRLNNSDEFNILFSINQVENEDKTNISQNTDDDLLLAKLGTVIECKDKNKEWYKKLYQCDEFYQKYKKMPSEHTNNKYEKTLCLWIRVQRRNYKKKNKRMTQERIQACETYEWWVWEVDMDKKWYDALKECDEFYKTHHKIPSSTSKNKEEKTLRSWIGTQRTNYKKKNKSMTQERIQACESCEWWVWDFDSVWYDTLKACDAFYQTHQKLPSNGSKNKEEKQLGTWITNQRTKYKKKNKCMTKEHIQACEAYEWWVWEVDNDGLWHDTLKACDAFYQKYQKQPSSTSKSKEEKTLCLWIRVQRTNYKNKNTWFTQERIDACQAYAWWVWDFDKNKIWFNKLKACGEFYKKNKIIPSNTSEDKDETALARWIGIQRKNYKKKNKCMTQERIQACEALDWWVWEVDVDKVWYDTLKACDEFYKTYQKLPSNSSKNKEEKTLGIWICHQRENYKKKNKCMTQERIQACEALEWWVWGNDEIWRDTLKECDEFYKTYQKLPSNSSKNKEEKTLGSWISDQRKNYKKKNKRMTQERIQACEKHEWWVWEDDKDGKWYDTLKACDAFYQTYQNIPSSCSKNKEEKTLGSWIRHQRENYKKKNKCMTQERIQECEKHDWWVWDGRKVIPTKSQPNSASINTTNSTNNTIATKTKKSMTIKSVSKNDKQPQVSQKVKSKIKTMSKISQLHKTYKTMNSTNLHNLFQQDKTKWHEYHKIAEANDATFDEESIPRNQIISDLSNIKGKRERIVVDMGCGMKHVANHFEAKKDNKFIFKNYDHISIDESVESCDISSLPLENDSVEICILSLAMWGSNCASYVKEAYRVLESRGQLYIIEATKRWTSNMENEACFGDKLKVIIKSEGFHIRREVINKFTYLVCEK
jgi:superfamily II DNA or RNA helicase